jgi:uncharacterized protein (DUF433 family)
MNATVIQTGPQVMGGTPVFAGTRVPIATLLDYLEAGESIDDFLDGFPSVRRDQVIGFLKEIKERTLAPAYGEPNRWSGDRSQCHGIA